MTVSSFPVYSACSSSVQCKSSLNLACISDVCNCNDTTKYWSSFLNQCGKCFVIGQSKTFSFKKSFNFLVPKSNYNDYCNSSSICLTNFCYNQTCQCAQWKKWNNSTKSCGILFFNYFQFEFFISI